MRILQDRIIEALDFRSFYSGYTKLNSCNGGSELKGLCPLHQEKTPSFFVKVSDGSFKCFGCGKGGGPIQFYAARHDLDFSEGVRRLAEELGIRGTARAVCGGPGRGPVRILLDLPTTSSTTAVYAAVLKLGRPLPGKVIDYFKGRSLDSETVESYQVGFLDEPSQVAAELVSRFDRAMLLKSGLFREGNEGHLGFLLGRHPLVFPILENGQPVFLQGRRFDDSVEVSKYCNLSGVSVPGMFNAEVLMSLSAGSEVFVCEGVIDTMTLSQAGFAAVGVVGAGGFKKSWADQLRDFNVRVVFDNDEAGEAGAKRVRQMLIGQGARASIVRLPKAHEDVNEFFLRSSTPEFRELLSQACNSDLLEDVRALRRRVSDPSDGFSYADLGAHIFAWFESDGGGFLVGPESQCRLLFENRVYDVGHNRPFNALMLQRTGLLAVEHAGKMVWEVLQNLCFLEGRQEAELSWAHADKDSANLYINLHNEKNQVLVLGPGTVEVISNGHNDKGILLRAADKMSAIEFDDSVDPRAAVDLLRRLVMDPLACSAENRLFVVSWILTAFFLSYTTEKALLKLSGHAASGKTTAARLLSCLLYGADHVETSTVAYYYADASQNPFLVADNLETEDLDRRITQFLLHVATGIQKGKRKAGTDSQTVREASDALVAITAIEPLTKSELIGRTYDVEFRSVYKQPGFLQREHLERLIDARSRILSGLFVLFSREVLPNLQGERQAILATLQQRHRGHAKQRVDSFLTLMIVILRALLTALEPGGDRAWKIVDGWIRYQSRLASETERGTNATVFLLEALAREIVALGGEFRREYYLDVEQKVSEDAQPREIRFVARTQDVLMALQVLSRKKGFHLPFSNSQQLGVRLFNERSLLKRAGWTWRRKKIVRGLRYHEFRKQLA